jgi:hypothetical protein
VRSIVGAWERGDFSSSEWADPEIKFVITDGPAPGSSMGIAEMAKFWRDFLTAWEGYRVRADQYRELDAERVLVLLDVVGGRGKTSGMELERMGETGANLFHVRGGKVTKFIVYFDAERALADFSVIPEGGSP